MVLWSIYIKIKNMRIRKQNAVSTAIILIFIEVVFSGALFAQDEVIRKGYFYGVVGVDTLQNRTTDLKALLDVQNYLKANKKTYGEVRGSYLAVTHDTTSVTPEIIRDTIYIPKDTIKGVELIVTNSYLGPDVTGAFQVNRLKREIWFGNFESLESFKNETNIREADSTDYLTELRIGQSSPNLDKYVSKISGYLNPGLTGSYTFHCYVDDKLEMSIWKDDTEIKLLNQASYSLINQWDKLSGQTSQSILLDNNQRYYFEVLTYEGFGGDYFGVGWIKPGDTEIEIIPQLYLTEYE